MLPPPIRIVLGDDHALLHDALTRLLEPACTVLACAGSGPMLVDLAIALRPDVVITDMSMPGLSGLDATRRILAQAGDVRVVMLTMHDDPVLAAAAFRGGVSAFVLKSSAGSELLTAVRAAARDELYLTPLIMAGDVARLLSKVSPGVGAAGLTPRELEVLQLVAQGLPMKQVGAALHITRRTVAFHKYRLMKTLGVSSTAELVRVALQKDLIPPR